MLKINKKLKYPLIITCLLASGLLFFQYLTFIPEYSSAAPISTDTPITITPTTPLAKWDDLQYMQQMTPQACADAKVGDSKSLTDNSAGSNSKKTYNVQKIGSECWMIENMDNETGRVHHDDTYGGYYNWENAITVCTKMGNGWELPSQAQQQNIINSGYNTGMTLVGLPYKFQYGGFFHSEYGVRFSGESGYGYYWSSTPSGNIAYALTFNSYSAETKISNFPQYGYSARCVAKTTSDVTPVDPSAGGNTGINDPNISVTVPSIITLDVYSTDENNNVVDIVMDNNGSGTGQFTAKVSSNSAYNLSLSTIENGHTDLRNDNTNTSVPALSTTSPIVTTNDKSWWGIKCTNNPSDSTNCKQTNYTGLTNYLTPTLFYTSTQGANNNLTNFTIGIQTSPDLPSGTYSTSILITASQN